MRARDLSILGGALCLAAGAGLVFLSQESRADELPPDAAAVEVPAASTDTAPPPPALATEAVDRRSGGGAADAAAPNRGLDRPDTQGWTKGVVKGDIQLAVSVLPRITTMTVVVEEARSAITAQGFQPPTRFLVPIKLGAGTPTFEVTDIPFSAYPYVVSVHAPGLNGSRRVVTIDAGNPLVDDVVLAITPGAPFTVLVRDQDAGPYTGLDVRLLPVGEPAGRPRTQATTDNFGSIVFENVLAGDYQILVSQSGQSLGEAQTVTVQPGNVSFQSKIQGQGHVVTIARGVPLQVQINDGAGYGVGDAKVTATATDKIKLTALEATTNDGGRADFTHLTPGVWHVVVEKDKFERRDLNITIKAGQPPEFRELRLRRLRW